MHEVERPDHDISHLAANLPALNQELSPVAIADQYLEPQRVRRTIREIKTLLSFGPFVEGTKVQPFKFWINGSALEESQAGGLEGFVWHEKKLSRIHGTESLHSNLEHYETYISKMLDRFEWSKESASAFQELRQLTQSVEDRYDSVVNFVSSFVDELHLVLKEHDLALWAKSARVYEIFPRAFNLDGRREVTGTRQEKEIKTFFRDVTSSDLKQLKAEGWDSVYVMGVFPIGERFRKGYGSPFSVQDHRALNSELGELDDFKAFVDKAHQVGLKVVMDLIPNHTSPDSEILKAKPELYIHVEGEDPAIKEPPYGYFTHYDQPTARWLWIRHGGYDNCGQRDYWTDTAQLDYSNPDTRREMIDIAKHWVRQTGVDGFRVDMSYQLTNSYIKRNWSSELANELSEEQFMRQLVRDVREEFPQTGFIAEAYDKWDVLSEAGFDLIYGKNDMGRPGGHSGWYDSIASRDSRRINNAIDRAAFLEWQKGGAAMAVYLSDHDLPSLEKSFGEWRDAALTLSLMLPGGHMFYGSQEVGHDNYNPATPSYKPIPFSLEDKVDWTKDPELFERYNSVMGQVRKVHSSDQLEIVPLQHLQYLPHGISGFALEERGTLKAIVVANSAEDSKEIQLLDKSVKLPPLHVSVVTPDA